MEHVRKYGSGAKSKRSQMVDTLFQQNAMPVYAFELGVFHTLFKCFVLGAFPQYFFGYATLQCLPMLFLVIRAWSVPPVRTPYLAEFCWFANILIWVFMALEMSYQCLGVEPVFSDETRAIMAQSFFGVANGPLISAALLNSNSLVFHDPARMAGLFIHVSPAIVTWTVQWNQAIILETWPNLMALESNRAAFMSYDPSLIFITYFLWWVLYAVWLLTYGCFLPDQGLHSSFGDWAPKCQSLLEYITPFHAANRRLMGCVYLAIHAISCGVSSKLAHMLAYSFEAHTAVLFVVACSAIYQAGRYYRYAFGPMVAQKLKQELRAMSFSEKQAAGADAKGES